MAYNQINASFCVLLFEVSQIWLWRYHHWVLKNKGFIQHHRWKSWQIAADRWHFKACCSVLVFKDFFFPLKAVLVGIDQGRPMGMSDLQWSAPCLRGSFCWVQNLPQGWFLWESCGEGGSEEVNWLEWNLCVGEELAMELAMAYMRIETREVIWCWGWVLEPEITFRPGESTRQQLPAGVSAHNITKLQDLWFVGFFYLCDFLKYLMFMNSDIWGSEL